MKNTSPEDEDGISRSEPEAAHRTDPVRRMPIPRQLGNRPARSLSTSEYPAPDLGVLFVHGVGSQRRGETVSWAGEAFYKWLKCWWDGIEYQPESTVSRTKKDPNVRLVDTRLARVIPSEGDAPSYARLMLRPPDHDPQCRQWLLAESCWANDFSAPSYGDALPLSLAVTPLIIQQIGAQILQRADALLGQSGQPDENRSAVAELGVRLKKGSIWLLALVPALFLVFVVGSIVQVLMLAVPLLGLIPFLSEPMTKLQFHLAGWIGDAWVMAASPVRLDAMVSQVRRDVRWLASEHANEGRCAALAVVADSGGTYVAHTALTGPDAPRLSKPLLFITTASAQRKIHTMAEFNKQRPAFYTVSQALRILGTISLFVALMLLLFVPSQSLWAAALGVGGLLVNAILFRWTEVNYDPDDKYPYEPLMPERGKWVDYAAQLDITPGKDIIAKVPDEARTEVNVTRWVSNLHSPIKDHEGYWRNQEQVIADIARRLHEQAYGTDIAQGEAKQVLDNAWQYREKRVLRYFTAGLLVMASLPAIWFSLEPWLARNVGEPLRSFLVGILTDNVGDAFGGSFGLSTFWAYALGLMVVAGAMVLFYQLVVFGVWRTWSRAEERAMFSKVPLDDHCRQLRHAFALLSLAVPFAALTALAARITERYLTGQLWNDSWSDFGNWAYIALGVLLGLTTIIVVIASIVNARAAWKEGEGKATSTRPTPGALRSTAGQR